MKAKCKQFWFRPLHYWLWCVCVLPGSLLSRYTGWFIGWNIGWFTGQFTGKYRVGSRFTGWFTENILLIYSGKYKVVYWVIYWKVCGSLSGDLVVWLCVKLNTILARWLKISVTLSKQKMTTITTTTTFIQSVVNAISGHHLGPVKVTIIEQMASFQGWICISGGSDKIQKNSLRFWHIVAWIIISLRVYVESIRR